jgi:hypothetical protein
MCVEFALMSNVYVLCVARIIMRIERRKTQKEWR